MAGSFEGLSRDRLAALVPELLLAGHLIDRAGMPHALTALGRAGMGEVAIDEWMAASPVYTARMQAALGFAGTGVETIFKGMQLDIGAPPQFMDFRYRVHDHDSGEFWLDHCGALLDVEPMGDDYVHTMCHDIEDPTFDATAIATNPRAQVRPVHRPPRVPADRHPHCHWTVTIRPENEPLPVPSPAIRMRATAAATVALSPIDPSEPGLGDYSGPLLDDLRFSDWSRSALVRIAEEVCLQGHMLALGFRWAVAGRVDDEAVADLCRHQLAGIAGLTSDRLHRLFGSPTGPMGLAAVLAVHPLFQPVAYTGVEVVAVEPRMPRAGPPTSTSAQSGTTAVANTVGPEPSGRVGDAPSSYAAGSTAPDDDRGVASSDRVILRLPRASPAIEDGGWLALIDATNLAPLDALVRGVDPCLSVRTVDDGSDALVLEVVAGNVPAVEAGDVALTRFSGGAGFDFADRGSPVTIGRSTPNPARS